MGKCSWRSVLEYGVNDGLAILRFDILQASISNDSSVYSSPTYLAVLVSLRGFLRIFDKLHVTCTSSSKLQDLIRRHCCAVVEKAWWEVGAHALLL